VAQTHDTPEFRTSSYCNSGTCVEVAVGSAVVAVRDKKNPAAGHIQVQPGAWARFLGGIRSNRWAQGV
jgi:hypothetical protein